MLLAFAPAGHAKGGGSKSSGSSAGKSVSVSGYTRKDGTHVQAHTRSAPGSGPGRGPSSLGFSVPVVPAAPVPHYRTQPRVSVPTTPRTDYNTQAREDARGYSQPGEPAPPDRPPADAAVEAVRSAGTEAVRPPALMIKPPKGGSVPLGKTDDSLGYFLAARQKNNYAAIASMRERNLIATVDAPTGVRSSYVGPRIAFVVPTEGPHAGVEWAVLSSELVPYEPGR